MFAAPFILQVPIPPPHPREEEANSVLMREELHVAILSFFGEKKIQKLL